LQQSKLLTALRGDEKPMVVDNGAYFLVPKRSGGTMYREAPRLEHACHSIVVSRSGIIDQQRNEAKSDQRIAPVHEQLLLTHRLRACLKS
jgi:hypothetical protein